MSWGKWNNLQSSSTSPLRPRNTFQTLFFTLMSHPVLPKPWTPRREHFSVSRRKDSKKSLPFGSSLSVAVGSSLIFLILVFSSAKWKKVYPISQGLVGIKRIIGYKMLEGHYRPWSVLYMFSAVAPSSAVVQTRRLLRNKSLVLIDILKSQVLGWLPPPFCSRDFCLDTARVISM